MSKIVRLGDMSSHGGSMITASANFKANGITVCVNGDLHRCPMKDHGITSVVSSRSFTSNGRSIISTGNVAGCGAVLVTGSENTVTD